MKHFLACALSLLLTFGIVFPCAAAAEIVPVDKEAEILALADGGYIAITREEYIALAANTKSGSATYTRNSNSGSTLWIATLTGTFTYNGVTSTCTDADLVISISDNSYYTVSQSVNKSGNTATASFTIGYKVLGVTYKTESYTITLSCDKNGNLS